MRIRRRRRRAEALVIDPVPKDLVRILTMAEWAAEEIERVYPCRAKPGTPERREWADATRPYFYACIPSVTLQRATEVVYRAHCREMIARVDAGDSLEYGSDAEILVVMMETSYNAPLNRVGQALYERLFKGIFPEAWAEIFGDLPPSREIYPGSFDEEIAALRRRLVVKGRGRIP